MRGVTTAFLKSHGTIPPNNERLIKLGSNRMSMHKLATADFPIPDWDFDTNPGYEMMESSVYPLPWFLRDGRQKYNQITSNNLNYNSMCMPQGIIKDYLIWYLC